MRGIVDNRQSQKIIHELVRKYGFKTANLTVGHFLTDELIIMRSTYDELLNYIKTQKFKDTLIILQKYDRKIVWIIEGNLQTAYFKKYDKYGLKNHWKYDSSRKIRILNTISSLIVTYGFSVVHSDSIDTTIQLVGKLNNRTPRLAQFAILDRIESPIKGINNKKYADFVSLLTLISNKRFSVLTNQEIVQYLEEIRYSTDPLYKIKGIADKSFEKMIRHYKKNIQTIITT